MSFDLTAAQKAFKDRYVGTSVGDLLPEEVQIQRDVKFDSANKLGKNYVRAVWVNQPAGWTFQGTSNRGTVGTLNGVVSGTIEDASVTPTEFILQENVSYGVLASMGSKEQAFGTAMDLVTYGMKKSAAFAQEIYNLYGRYHIGAIESYSGSSTTRAYVISKATWAAGIWAQMSVGAKLDAHDGLASTKTNTNADVVVVSIDPTTRTVNVSGNATDLTNIDADTAPVFVPKGCDGSTQEWGYGLRKILSHSSGSLFDINTTTYPCWKANSKTVTAALKFADIASLMADCYIRGGGGKRILYVSPYTWADLNNDSMEFRRDTRNGGGDFSIGAKDITVNTLFGDVEIRPHTMVMAGDALLIKPDVWRRIGTTDHTWTLPGKGADNFFTVLESSSGVQMRCYWDCTMFPNELAPNGIITGIVNNSGPA